MPLTLKKIVQGFKDDGVVIKNVYKKKLRVLIMASCEEKDFFIWYDSKNEITSTEFQTCKNLPWRDSAYTLYLSDISSDSGCMLVSLFKDQIFLIKKNNELWSEHSTVEDLTEPIYDDIAIDDEQDLFSGNVEASFTLEKSPIDDKIVPMYKWSEILILKKNGKIQERVFSDYEKIQQSRKKLITDKFQGIKSNIEQKLKNIESVLMENKQDNFFIIVKMMNLENQL